MVDKLANHITSNIGSVQACCCKGVVYIYLYPHKNVKIIAILSLNGKYLPLRVKWEVFLTD